MKHAPPESGRTLVGIEPGSHYVDHSVPRAERSTPTRGDDMLDMDQIRALGPESAAIYLAEQLGALRESIDRIRDVAAEAKSISGTAAAHSDRAATVSSDMMDRVNALVARANKIQTDVETVIEAVFVLQPLPARVHQAFKLIVELQSQVAEVKLLIGMPPVDLSGRHSLTRELTKEEYEQLEQGTGLAGVIGRLVVGQKRLERRVGIAAALGSVAASSPSWVPAVWDAASKIFGG